MKPEEYLRDKWELEVQPAPGSVVKIRRVEKGWEFSGDCPTVALEDALKLLIEGVTGGWESMRRYARGSP